MEQIIIDYDYPLLFILKNAIGERFLCMCYNTRGAQQWIVTPISKSQISDFLQNKISLREPFEDSSTTKIYATHDYRTQEDSFKCVESHDILSDDLPAKGEYLDSEENEWDDYLFKLGTKCIWESQYSLIHSSILSSFNIKDFNSSKQPLIKHNSSEGEMHISTRRLKYRGRVRNYA
jgi:hypothetical protein